MGSCRGAAALGGTTHKAIKQIVLRHEGGVAPARRPRKRNFEPVAEPVAAWVAKTAARISANRLPDARAAD